MPDEGESRQVKAVIDIIINKIIKKASRILSNERGIADNIPSVSEVCGELAEQNWAKCQRHEARYALLSDVLIYY